MVYASMLGGQASIPDAAGLGQPLFYFFVALAVLIVPTACMGATLPVLIRYVVTRDEQIGGRVGGLYAINTLGAVGGAVVAGFVLLPSLGLRGTVWCGVAVNVLVFLIAVLVAKASAEKDTRDTDAEPEVTTNPEPNSAYRFAWMILPVMTLSGIGTFVYEVLWTQAVVPYPRRQRGRLRHHAGQFSQWYCASAVLSPADSRKYAVRGSDGICYQPIGHRRYVGIDLLLS